MALQSKSWANITCHPRGVRDQFLAPETIDLERQEKLLITSFKKINSCSVSILNNGFLWHFHAHVVIFFSYLLLFITLLAFFPTSHWYPLSSRVPLLFSCQSDPYSVCTSLSFYHQCVRLLPHILPCSCCSFPWWCSFCLRQEVMMYFQFAFPLDLRILNCFLNIYQAFLFLSLETIFSIQFLLIDWVIYVLQLNFLNSLYILVANS